MGKENSTAAQAVAEAEELPKTIVRRVVKDKLSDVSGDGGDVILHKEALLAFSESARIFIHYLSATAHDICNESRRQIINAEDVLNAFEEIEFSEFVEPLRLALDEFRKKAAGKRAGAAMAKDVSKKRKTDADTTKEKGGDETEDNNGYNSDEGEEQENGDKVEEQASGDNEDEGERQLSGDNEVETEEQADGDNEEETVEQASGDDEEETDEQASADDVGEGEEQNSGDDENEVEAQSSED